MHESGSSYDAQQFGGFTLVGKTNGYRLDLDKNAQVQAFCGLSLVRHAVAIQAAKW